MKNKYTWRILGLVACLLLGLVTVSCHKEEEISEEQAQIVLANAEVVMDKVSEMYEASETVEEMEQHLAEIRAMSNVEDAYRDDIAICVKIKDGGIIMWCFYPDSEEEDKNALDLDELLKNTSKSVSSFKGGSLCEEKSICLLNVINRPWEGEYDKVVRRFKDELDWITCIKKGEEVNLEFIKHSLPDYGVTILHTHGGFFDGQHWLMTGQVINNDAKIDWSKTFELWIKDLERFFYPNKGLNNRENSRPHELISETYLKENITKNFPENSIVFLAACNSYKGNKSLWEILKGKGLGCLIGFDNTVNGLTDMKCCVAFMEEMLNGATAKDACFVANGKIPFGEFPEGGLNLLCRPINSDIILVENEPVGDDWVDLGLPSGLLWATRNVGATSPEDYGDQFAWGETTPKSVYDWSTYRYCNGYNNMNYLKLTKYCNNSHYGEMGFTDNLTILQPDDDAATANYGGRTPTIEEWQELGSNTTSRWTFINGVYGQILTGSNGNSLFLPDRDYWSSLLYTYHPLEAWYVYFDTYRKFNYGSNRCNGLFVRAVLSAQ